MERSHTRWSRAVDALAGSRRIASRQLARSATPRSILLGAALLCAACGPEPGTARSETEAEPRTAMVADHGPDRFQPGLHRLMVDLQFRHANVWFAGEAENWALANYHMHEIEELVGEIGELHPTYEEVPVAELMNALLAPAVQELAAAVDDGDGPAFEMAFDQLTARCNACHDSTGRGMIVVQRPRTPPFDNVRFAPTP